MRVTSIAYKIPGKDEAALLEPPRQGQAGLVRQTLRISAELGNDLITALLFCLFTLLSVGGNSTRAHTSV